MNTKKCLLLGIAVIAAAAFVAPAGASALMLYYSGKPIEKPIATELSGTLNWKTSSGNGFDCSGTTYMDSETNDAKVTALALKTSSCVGTGATQNCEMTWDQNTNVPWTADLDSDRFTVTDQTIDYEYTCPFSQPVKTTLSFEKASAIVDSASAIKKLKFSGTGIAGLESATLSGEMEVLGEAAGKLSIAE